MNTCMKVKINKNVGCRNIMLDIKANTKQANEHLYKKGKEKSTQMHSVTQMVIISAVWNVASRDVHITHSSAVKSCKHLKGSTLQVKV